MGQCDTRRPADWREGRRLRAWELKQQGWSQHRIAAALGVTDGAVSQWMRRQRDGGGVEALYRRPPPGPTPKLTPEQRARLPALLARGPEAYGFMGDVWTQRRIAAVIRRELGVRYHSASLTRLLRAIGWRPRKPQTRATQRDEVVIRAWFTDVWPALSAKPGKRGAPSCSWTSRLSTSCPPLSAPTPPAGTRQFCGCRSRGTTCPPSAASRKTGGCSCTPKNPAYAAQTWCSSSGSSCA